jgi:hypothetical protein
LTINAPLGEVTFINSQTQTITNFSVAGTNSGTEVLIRTDDPISGRATISSANSFACSFCGLNGMAFTGAGTFTAPNSFDFGFNQGITITPPSAGGGGRIIGG